MIIESEFDNRSFAEDLVTLREQIDLPIEVVAQRIGVEPGLVQQWEQAKVLPTEEQKRLLEQVLDWPLVLPPRQVVPVQFGDWKKLFDERIAPLAREMLLAGFPTRITAVDNLGIHIRWPQPHRALDFLNIVTRFEKGSHTMYSRVDPQANSTGRIPKWNYGLAIMEMADREGNDDDVFTQFFGGLEMDIPPHDVATVVARLMEYNEPQGKDTKPTRPVSREPRKIYVPVLPYYQTRISSYHLWATPISDDVAIVDNIPMFTDEIAYRDIVRVSPNGDFLELLERLTHTVRAHFKVGKSEADSQRTYAMVREHFEKNGITCERMTGGMFNMAVPSTIMDDRFQELWNTCPAKVYHPGEKPKGTA